METVETKRPRKKKEQTIRPLTSEKVITEDDIRKRAFEIYLQNKGTSNATDNWLKAERELKKSF